MSAGVEFGFAAADGAVLTFIPSLPDRAAIGITYGSTAYPEGPNGPAAGRRIPVCLTSGGASCTVTDTGLSALSLTDADSTAVTLDPTFSSGIGVYEAEVANAVSTVTVAATASAAGATVAIAPADADGTTNGHQVDLSEGENTITVTVTNGGVSEDHTVTVTREAALPANVLWSATLTVGSGTSGFADHYGYGADASGPDSGGFDPEGSLDDDTFDLPGVTPAAEATVKRLSWETDTRELNLGLTLPDSFTGYSTWTIHVGEQQASFAGITPNEFETGRFRFVFTSFFTAGNAPSTTTGEDVEVCITTDGGGCDGGGTTEALDWTATLTVAAGTKNDGYCANPCLIPNENHQDSWTLVPNSFTLPGTDDETVTVTAVAWPKATNDLGSGTSADEGDLTLGLSPLPEADVYGQWTLGVLGVQVALKDVDAVVTVTGGALLHFDDVLSSATRPSTGTQTITLSGGGGTAEPFAWDASLTVDQGSGASGYCGSDCADLDDDGNHDPALGDGLTGSLSDGTDNAFDVPGTSDSVAVTLLAWGPTDFSDEYNHNLYLRLSPYPSPASVYQAWTVNVGGVEGSLSGGTLNSDNILVFTDFFTAATNPETSGTVAVCIRSDSGTCGGSGAGGTEAPADGLEARFGAQPAWHTGMPFWTELHFSAEPDIGYKDLRDQALEATGARIARAQRIDKGSKRSWRLQVVPDGFGDISLTLPATEDCAAEGAVCTAEGEPLETGLALAVPGPGDRLAARLKGTSSHTGEAFRLKLHFNHEPNLGYRDVRDKLFAETAGRVSRAQRLVKGSNLGWRLTVEPEGLGAVGLELPATESCSAEGAVCTKDGRKLERGISWTVQGPPAFSVSDAEVEEEPGAVLAFEVSLSRRVRTEARVDVATVDGTATAGSDYEAVTQTLVFAPGETLKTVEVVVLDDAHDEGEETMTLVLSNAEGALIDDGEGTGTIVNNDAIPKAWIARFGRTVTGQVLDAVEARLAAPRQAGGRMTLAGYPLAARSGSGGSARSGARAETSAQATVEDRAALAALGDRMDGARTGRRQDRHERRDGGPEPKSLDITRHRLVTGTAFTLSTGSADGGFASLWGRGTITRFDGREDALTLDGEVTTGLLGADWAAERWTAGLALGHSAGTGGYRDGACEAGSAQSGACGGRIEAELTGLYPYAGLDVTERVSVWLAAGHGAGELTVIPDGSGAIGTDLSMRMGAGGTRIAVRKPDGGAGLSLALKGDGRFTRTSSDAARAPDGGNLAEAEADVWLLRLGVEGSRPFSLGGSGTGDGTGASLTPSFEVGVRRDGGDAETGFGADMGGGLALAAPERGLRFDLKGRALVAHEAPGFREWGASAGFGFDPRPSTERGLSLSLTQAYGATPSGGMDALLDRETLAGFAPSDANPGRFEASSRLTGELGYGLRAFGGGFTGTPNVGFGLSETGRDWRLGWRLTPERPGASGFEVTLDATRRESARADAEHGMSLRSQFRW